jgi:hypothetical protein
VIHEPGSLTVIAEDAKHRNRGEISLTLADAPLSLTGWSVREGRGGAVKVRVEGLAHSPPRDASFFELPDPRATPDAKAGPG